MKRISHAQLVEKIRAIRGNTIIGIESLTDARANKTGNPFGKILKQSRAVVSVGANYQNAVNRQGEREENQSAGEFVAEPLPWGEWMEPGKLISHKGNVYLRTQTTPGQRKIKKPVVKFRDESGRFLARKDVEPFLPKKSESQRQKDFGNEGEIQVRTFALSSIRRLRIGGESFVVEH